MFVRFQHEVRRRRGYPADGGQFIADEKGHFLQVRARDEQEQVESTRHQVERLHFGKLADAVRDLVEAAFALGGYIDFDGA